ncbi:NUDIX domain-containing protein [Streptosporangium amethystogenes]|uniref:NUDIX domain-containing protein n=1 Tax=Streptosporangium amethystogenes TaxID=2002 RepID=UPI00068FA44C|nr:NUDIX hydrolase [Streptosporangium amethystogenes]
MTQWEAGVVVAEVLRRIPAADESALPIAELGADEALIALLGVFGVLTVTERDGVRLVKATHPAATWFLRSLAEYADSGKALADWTRNRAGELTESGADILAGPQLLYLMERQRARFGFGARPLREVRVAQVLIKARLRGEGECYLVLYDGAARQYQLPGGKARPTDSTPREVAIRELEEELPGFAFDTRTDQLVEFCVAHVVQPSRTMGVLTAYEMTFFQLRSSRDRLAAWPDASWVQAATLLAEDAKVGGTGLDMGGLRKAVATLPGGLDALPLSLNTTQRRTLRHIARARPWEFYGMAVGVLGLVCSIVFFLLDQAR